MQNNNKKICIVVSSLGKGGAERTSALISKMLSSLGYNVHIISLLNAIDYEYSGTLLNLGILKDKNDTILGRFNRFKVFKRHIKKERFDLIIDSRSRPTGIKELLISKLIYKSAKVIYIVHSFNLDISFPKNKWLANIIYKNAYRLVSVSTHIKTNIRVNYKLDNVSTIYNAVDIESNSKQAQSSLKLNNEFILFFGRLDDKVKNIKLLIEAYSMSKLPSENIQLVLLGDGEDKDDLEELVKQKDLAEHIIFIPFSTNPFPYIKEAKYTVLTSRFEGFPMVLIESLSVGTPVISVDCDSGPEEIIKNEFNGLLVKNNNAKGLAEAMNSFIFDEQLYQQCKTNAKESVANFSVDKIAKDWQNLIENTI